VLIIAQKKNTYLILTIGKVFLGWDIFGHLLDCNNETYCAWLFTIANREGVQMVLCAI
jgi:hypothetical protein